MKLDVRKHDTVWIVMRRENPHSYHIQGVAVATEDCGAEEIAVGMCRDATYFIGPLSVNVSYPEKAFEWKGCYFPLKHPKKVLKGERAAPSEAAAKRAASKCAVKRSRKGKGEPV